MNVIKCVGVVAVATLLTSGLATSAAHAGSVDADRDGIPTRWERSHGMNPFRAADAARDFDLDGLTNLREYRVGSFLRDEDSDNDGHDDGDEVRDGFWATDVDDSDTDSDGLRDGDEDTDRDGTDNEDEDDAAESCVRDDDDRDRDDVADEDEHELGLRVLSADSDSDGIEDGEEDSDQDGEANEDDDDSLEDVCDGDSDDDGECDEDEGDLLGLIESFDSATGTLVVTGVSGHTISGVVTEDTELEFEDVEDTDEPELDGTESDEDAATTADLVPGVQVAEIEFDDETGTLDEVEIYRHAG